MESQASPTDGAETGGHRLRDELGLSRRRGERWSRFLTRVGDAFGMVLLLVLTTYVLESLVPFDGWTAPLITAAAVAAGIVSLVSARAREPVVRAGVSAGVAAFALTVVAAAADSSTALGVAALLVFLLLAAATVEVLAAVISEEQVGFRTILGAISVYVQLGLLFVFVYVAVDRLQDGLFFGQTIRTGDYVFFSVTTLTTTGYGNLVPTGQPGRMLAGLEMLVGQIFLVTLIAGLVSLWRPGSWRRGRPAAPPPSPEDAAESSGR
jgi:hypothetical protein